MAAAGRNGARGGSQAITFASKVGEALSGRGAGPMLGA
jgi:hypothetical protein